MLHVVLMHTAFFRSDFVIPCFDLPSSMIFDSCVVPTLYQQLVFVSTSQSPGAQSSLIKKLLFQFCVEDLDCPAQSPDLHPIRHL